MRFYLSHKDFAMLNSLFGKALLDDDVQSALLHRDGRRDMLDNYTLTTGAITFLMSLEDSEDLGELARTVYDQLIPH